MTRLGTLIAAAVVAHCTSVFSRHRIPEIVVTDNGPQFSKVPSSVFASFACDNFEHVISSPKYPQGISLAEAAVKILKQSLKKTGDLYLTLLAYRSSRQAKWLLSSRASEDQKTVHITSGSRRDTSSLAP